MRLAMRRNPATGTRVNSTDIFMWVVGGLLLLLIIVGSVSTLVKGTYSVRDWFDFVVFGVAQGAIYALIALGYTLVYGILRMINFAHSEVFMSGPFTAYFVADGMYKSGFLEANPIVGLVVIFLVSMAISVGIALLLERIAYRPLRNAPRLVPLITAIGASLFLQYAFRGLYGAGLKAYPELTLLAGAFDVGPYKVLKVHVLVIVAAAGSMSIMYYVVQRTKVGKTMRAVSE